MTEKKTKILLIVHKLNRISYIKTITSGNTDCMYINIESFQANLRHKLVSQRKKSNSQIPEKCIICHNEFLRDLLSILEEK